MAGMERLTRKIGGSVVFPTELLGVSLAPHNEYMHKLLTRLAAYEDTGIAPEEVVALRASHEVLKDEAVPLLRAKIEDRLAVLPCKVGDIVYDIQDGMPYATRVISFSYFGDHWACRTVSSYPDLELFGERVFLTHAEAVAALAKQKE